MAFAAGKGSRIKIGSTNVRVTEWASDIDTDTHDVSSTEGNGYREFIFGLTGGEVTFRMVVDITTTPITVIGSGVSGTVTVYPVAATTSSNISGTVLISKSRIVAENAGLVTMEGSGKFSGTITPTGL